MQCFNDLDLNKTKPSHLRCNSCRKHLTSNRRIQNRPLMSTRRITLESLLESTEPLDTQLDRLELKESLPDTGEKTLSLEVQALLVRRKLRQTLVAKREEAKHILRQSLRDRHVFHELSLLALQEIRMSMQAQCKQRKFLQALQDSPLSPLPTGEEGKIVLVYYEAFPLKQACQTGNIV